MKKAIAILGGIGSLFYFAASLMIGYELYNSIFGLIPSSMGMKIYAGVVGVLMIALPVCYGMELVWSRKKPRLGNGSSMFFFAWALIQLVLYRLIPQDFYAFAQLFMLHDTPFYGIGFFDAMPPSLLLMLAGTALILATCVLAALGNKRQYRREQEQEQA